jgi:hypothetical protein
VFFKASFALFLVVIVVVTLLAIPRDEGQARPADAEAAARHWVGGGDVQPARIEDDEWEVDVRRPDGSLVEVTFDHELNLRDLDEELARRGALAHDEVVGPVRSRAIRAAFQVTGAGRVTSVERDARDEIEVNIQLRDGSQVEVELDSALRVGEVEDEDPADE